MALRLEQKQALVEEVNAVAGEAQSLVAADYRGLTVEQMTNLRREARDAGVYMRVLKNTLARRAIVGTDFECVKEELRGPLLLAFSREDPASAARVLKGFAKENERLVPRLVSIGGKNLPASELDRLASLPTREQALGMLLGVLQAPIGKLVRTMAEPPAKLVRILAAVRDQRQSQSA